MKRVAMAVVLVLLVSCGDRDALSPDAQASSTTVSFAKAMSHGCTYSSATSDYTCNYEFDGLPEGSTWDVWLDGYWYYYLCVNAHSGRPSRRYPPGTPTLRESVAAATGAQAVDGRISGTGVIEHPGTTPAFTSDACSGASGPFTTVEAGLAPAGSDILLVIHQPGPQD